MIRTATLVLTLVLIASTACHAETIGPNLVRNPSFEQLGEHGWPVGWEKEPPVYSPTDEIARTGERCLKWQNDDPDRYVLLSQEVPAEPGRRYEFEVWVRTEDLQGGGSGATTCMQWSDADGDFLGGTWPAGVKGDTLEWTRIRAVSDRVPDDAATVTVLCYVRKDMTGTAWFDDCSVRQYRGPLLETMTTNLYRGRTTGGIVEVHAGVNLQDYDYAPRDVRATLAVRSADGNVVRTVRPDSRSVSELTFSFATRSLPMGEYDLVLQAGTADGELSGELTTQMRRTDHAPDYHAYIDEHQRLIVDGQPVFPLGTYWNRLPDYETSLVEQHLDIYADSAFNCLMPYDSWDIDEGQLDACHERGISVIFSVKSFYAGRHGLRTREDARQRIEEYVTRFGDHPAIIAWYINDELPLSMYDQLRAHQLWMEELDPTRPTWSVTHRIGQITEHLGTFDVIGTDPYPIPHRTVALPLRWTRRTVQDTLNLKPVWMVPQIFNWASYHRDETENYRPPTLEEMRSMAWQCIAGGANGLVFYSWMDLWRVEQRGGESFDERWAEVRQMAAEIDRFVPLLLSVEPAMQPRRVEAPETVGWRVYGQDRQTFLVAVNADREPVTATFEFPRTTAEHEVLFRSPRVEADGARVQVRLDALEPTVIALTPGGDVDGWADWRERWRD
jgi:hypothetical protein